MPLQTQQLASGGGEDAVVVPSTDCLPHQDACLPHKLDTAAPEKEEVLSHSFESPCPAPEGSWGPAPAKADESSDTWDPSPGGIVGAGTHKSG